MQDKKIVALVPMRHHSQRVPQKNYRLVAGKPLYHYILTSLQQCDQIDAVVVDTDSDVIMEGIKKEYPDVQVISRPVHLCADEISMNRILLHDISLFPADFYIQTHSTNPLLKPHTIKAAIAAFLDKHNQFDSLFSVTRLQSRLWDQNTNPINHDPSILLQTQDLPPVFEENSCVYIFTGEQLARRENRIGVKPLMFEISPEEALDIDEMSDLYIVESMLRREQNT